MTKNVAILTGGGDCPGLNAVIRSAVRVGINKFGYNMFGILDGFSGLINNQSRRLRSDDVTGILPRGGTILGTSNKDNPFEYAIRDKGKLTKIDVTHWVRATFENLALDALIVVGGDGTLSIADRLYREHDLPVLGVPKTIDNDLSATDVTFGFDTAITTATAALDKLHSTAESHHRVMVVELMGRYAGWIALQSGLAGGAHIILIPELPFNLDLVCQQIEERYNRGRKFSIVVVAEGAKVQGGEMVAKKIVEDSPDPIRLGGISQVVADYIEKKTKQEVRCTILGHIQRGGTPTAFDRVLGTRLGAKAIHMVSQGDFGQMACVRGTKIEAVGIKEAIAVLRKVKSNSELIVILKEMGICFGDELVSIPQ